jgi:hypothetical protein
MELANQTGKGVQSEQANTAEYEEYVISLVANRLCELHAQLSGPKLLRKPKVRCSGVSNQRVLGCMGAQNANSQLVKSGHRDRGVHKHVRQRYREYG